jgi:uncharacterized cupredoxin-like copper-binding protein
MKTFLAKLLAAALLSLSLSSPSWAAGQHDAHDHDHGMEAASPAGAPGDPAKARKVIAVKMLDSMRFEPSEIRVKSGQTVKFSVTNAGAIRHEFGIGTKEEQKAHAEMMLADPTMKHEEGSVITVEPGETKELVWRFGKPGTYEAACQIPGHYPAGMVARIVVTR